MICSAFHALSLYLFCANKCINKSGIDLNYILWNISLTN